MDDKQLAALNTLISAHKSTIKTLEDNKMSLTGRMMGINVNGLKKEIESLEKQKETLEQKLGVKSKDSLKENDLSFLGSIE